MAKIGRNEKCPCRSGKKYKHCCANKPKELLRPLSPEEKLKVTLMGGVEQLEESAVAKKEKLIELGVFFLFSTSKGDGWLFEVTQQDCVQLVAKGEKCQPVIKENSETIEIDWSHTFSIKKKKIEMKAYADKTVSILEDAPVQQIAAMRKRIMKKFSAEQLEEVHISSQKLD